MFNKLINQNSLNNVILSSSVAEYDIQNCGATMIRKIYGDEKYNQLMLLEKYERNVKIGKMMRDTPGLSKEVDSMIIKYMNLFCEKNFIKEKNYIETTRDSIVLTNKIPTKTNIDGVVFRCKDGGFSSFVRLPKTNFQIFYDNYSHKILVKGVDSSVKENSLFIKNFLPHMMISLEKRVSEGFQKSLSSLQNDKKNYYHSKKPEMYKEVFNKNKFRYTMENDPSVEYESDQLPEDNISILTISNYENIIFPLIKIGIRY